MYICIYVYIVTCAQGVFNPPQSPIHPNTPSPIHPQHLGAPTHPNPPSPPPTIANTFPVPTFSLPAACTR